MLTKVEDFYAGTLDAAATTEAASPTACGLRAFEARFNEPRMQAMLREFLSGIEFPEGARVLDIGCGDGFATRRLAQWPNVAHTTGIDRSQIFVARARELAQGLQNVSFEEGDGRRTRFVEETFDVVVLHTVICHALGSYGGNWVTV